MVVTAGFVVHALSRLDGSNAEGIHVLWSGPPSWGYSVDGYRVLRRSARPPARLRCEGLHAAELRHLITIHVLRTDLATYRHRTESRPAPPPPLGGEWPHNAGGIPPLGIALPNVWNRFRIDLHEPQPCVEVAVVAAPMLAIAYRGEKAVDARTVEVDGPDARTRFAVPGVDRVDVHCTAIRELRVCVPQIDQEEDDWLGATIVAHVQLPVREADPALSDSAAELAVARSRMLDPSVISEANFADAALPLRELVSSVEGRPEDRVLLLRHRRGQGVQQYGLLDLGLVPMLDPDGRRMLGFAWIDREVEAGETYDYRVVGTFLEIDLVDHVFGFASVPGGTSLPGTFHLGDVLLRLGSPATVITSPARPGTGRARAIARRGVEIGPLGLRIELATAVEELTLEFAAVGGAAPDLSYEALRPGFVIPLGASFTGAVPPESRATLRFPEPVDRLLLSGTGFLTAVRVHGVIGSARDPARLVEATCDVADVRFEATPPPAAPAAVLAHNLQRRVLPGDARLAAEDPPAALGFRVRWQVPISGGAAVWPPESTDPTPFDAVAFVIEREEVSGPGGWRPAGPRLVFGNRHRPAPMQPIEPGTDVLAVFDDGQRTAGADPGFFFDDVLAPPDDPTAVAPGTRWRYRVAAIDATGRRSDWTESAVETLEKRRPPPQPVAPVDRPPPVDGELGVQAQVVDPRDPTTAPADLEVLGGHDNAIVLRWGWTDRERAHDPWATEFRVYVQEHPPDVVTGLLAGPVLSHPVGWEAAVQLSREVDADALRGLHLRRGDGSFRVLGNTDGASPTMRLARSRVRPDVAPVPGPFRLVLDLNGAEARPSSFRARVRVEPIEPARETYLVVLHDVLAVSAEVPMHTAWVGVSAADDQSYIPDGLPSGGRPGNESAIVTRAVTLRFRGRPAFEPPGILPDVPERVTDEPAAAVSVRVPLPDLVRPGTPPLVAGEPVQVDRLRLSLLTARLRIDGPAFAVRLPDGSSADYLPGAVGDQIELGAQISSGEPARVQGRFLMAVLVEQPSLAALFEPVGGIRPFGPFDDELSRDADRYLYRVRRADAAGHTSASGAVADEIVRVPSMRAPGRPELRLLPAADDRVRVRLRVRPTFELRWVLVFVDDEPVAEPPTPLAAPADLLRLANRRDLYPSDGIRLRTPGGSLLPPGAVLDVESGQADGELIALPAEVAVGHGRRARVWAVALTRDGIPSSPTGPKVATTPQPPITVPLLAVTRAANDAELTWDPGAQPDAEARPERLVGGGDWEPAGPWLPPGVGSWEELAPTGPVSYRLQLRTADGRVASTAPIPLPGA